MNTVLRTLPTWSQLIFTILSKANWAHFTDGDTESLLLKWQWALSDEVVNLVRMRWMWMLLPTEVSRLPVWITTGYVGNSGIWVFSDLRNGVNGKNNGGKPGFSSVKLRDMQRNYSIDLKWIVVDSNGKFKAISRNGMFEVRELTGMCTGYQVRNQIKWGRRKLENVYISLDNKNGVSQELNWSLRNEAEVQLRLNWARTTLSDLGSAPFPRHNHIMITNTFK